MDKRLTYLLFISYQPCEVSNKKVILLSRELILRRLCFHKGPRLVSDGCKLERNHHTPASSLVCFYRALGPCSSCLYTGPPESSKNTLYPVYCQNFVLSFYPPQLLPICWILLWNQSQASPVVSGCFPWIPYHSVCTTF